MNTDGNFNMTKSGTNEIVITREFDAPRKSVFEALTQPEYLTRWLLGPPGWSMTVCDVDLKIGGKYRYVWRHEEGIEMGVSGTYKEIKAPNLIANTETFDQAWYPGDSIITTELREKDGKTFFTVTIRYESQEGRDGVFESNMREGVEMSYTRLAKILTWN